MCGIVDNNVFADDLMTKAKNFKIKTISDDLRAKRTEIFPSLKEGLKDNSSKEKKETKFSNKLLETMIHEKCSGDFCEFVPLQSYRENYMLLKNNIDNKNVPFNHKLVDNICEPK